MLVQKILRYIVSAFILSLLFVPTIALGQSADFGTTYLTGVGLGTQDVRVVIINIIRIALGILGVLFFVIIIYGVVSAGGAGSGEGGAKARKTIGAGVVGLIIIVVAYALTTWVFNSIISATIETT